MKSSIIFFLLICVARIITIAQSTNWIWAKNFGSYYVDSPNIVKTDTYGNVYLAGYFRSPSISFDSITLTCAANGLSDNTDWFIAKLDSNGNALWARNGNSLMYAEATSIVIDSEENVYITGEFRTQTSFDTVILTNVHVSWGDIFIAKYNANGGLLWAKREGGWGYDRANSIALDKTGNFIYIVGNFDSDTLILASDTLINSGGSDVFLAKFDKNGNGLWAKNAGGSNNDNALSVAVDTSNNFFITGYDTSPSISFDSVTFENTGVFLVKYNSDGFVQWAKNFTGLLWDVGNSIAVDMKGNSYITGYFKSPILYVDNFTLTNNYPGWEDIFFIKTDRDGNVVWAKKAGGDGFDWGYSVDVDKYGSSYFVGGFGCESLNFDSIIIYNQIHEKTVRDIFIVKYDENGIALWAFSEGNVNQDFANSIALNESGNIYITGGFTSPLINFNNITLHNHYNLISNRLDIFLAKMDQSEISGTEDINISSDISIFPNPFSHSTKISFKQTYSRIIIEVYNIQGQLVHQSRYTDCAQILFNKNQLFSGLYVFKIIVDDKIVETKKVVVCD